MTIGTAINTSIHTPADLVKELILSSASISETKIPTGIANNITQIGFLAKGSISTSVIAIVISIKGIITLILAKELHDFDSQFCSNLMRY